MALQSLRAAPALRPAAVLEQPPNDAAAARSDALTARPQLAPVWIGETGGGIMGEVLGDASTFLQLFMRVHLRYE